MTPATPPSPVDPREIEEILARVRGRFGAPAPEPAAAKAIPAPPHAAVPATPVEPRSPGAEGIFKTVDAAVAAANRAFTEYRELGLDQRFQIIDTPVSFVCDPTGGGVVTRFYNYNITAVQSVSPAGSSSLAADNVSRCTYTYVQGASSRSGLVTISITISQSSETVNLAEQIHVLNMP